ncbi:MAG TPA: ATP-binding protein [Chitinophagales bacterium]|nr:ATP-binding protein [Chitinophagales bacterium]HRK27478.1 ATP-binding protein [Chitinophagales bacterium]
MLTRKTFNRWLLEGEGPLLDFKQNITSAPKIARAIVAFANSRGGKFLVGVGDKGHITGVDSGGEMYQLEKAAEQFCSPPVPITFDELEINGKTVLVAYVEESAQKPHFALDKQGQKQLFVRIADKCVAPDDLISQVLLAGDMNNLQRGFMYEQRKKELLLFLQQHKTISPQQYAQRWNTTERNARRSLLDFMFEGVITLLPNGAFETAPGAG